MVAGLFAQMRFNITAFEFQLSIDFLTKNITEIVIPPIGTIFAETHWTPVRISLLLRSIDLEALKDILEQGVKQQELLDKVVTELNRVIKIFLLRMLALGTLGGTLGILALHRKRIMSYFKGALAGLLIMACLLYGTYYSYDLSKFQNPHFEGALQGAPWMIDLFQEALVKVDILGKRMQVMAANLYQLFERLEQVEPIEDDIHGLKILHVSDIHNNPAAYDFIAQIADSFGVDVIVDTGDISDFGTPLEAKLVQRLQELKVPYLFVAGNHDSPAILEALQNINNVLVVNDRIFNVKGINFAGINDPASVSTRVIPPPEEKITEYANRLRGLIRVSEVCPDILMVHNPWLARQFAGQVPVILYGHNHRYSIDEGKGSVLVNAGTTGAAGVRGLIETNEIPYSLALLHFKKDSAWTLVAADTIKVFNLKSGFSVERRVFVPYFEDKTENNVGAGNLTAYSE